METAETAEAMTRLGGNSCPFDRPKGGVNIPLRIASISDESSIQNGPGQKCDECLVGLRFLEYTKPGASR